MQNTKIHENVFLNIRILVQYRRKTTKKSPKQHKNCLGLKKK